MTDEKINEIIKQALIKNNSNNNIDRFIEYCHKSIALDIDEACWFNILNDGNCSISEYEKAYNKIQEHRKTIAFLRDNPSSYKSLKEQFNF